jgi:hypothetical protein
MATRPTAVPTSFPEMIELAQFYLDRFHKTQDVIDLYPAVLTTAHVPDWFVEGVLNRRLEDERHALEIEFPIWRTMKDFANGLKHAVRAGMRDPSAARLLETERATTEYEHLDWWDHAGAPDQEIWQIEHDGQLRSIYSLCQHFLNEFRTWVISQLPSPK